MNYYYEIINPTGTRYQAEYDIKKSEQNFYGDLRLMQLASRIWTEDGKVVRIIKDRDNQWPQHVDMKEFIWIKLKC